MFSPIIVMSLATTWGCFTLLVSTSPIGSWASSVSLIAEEGGGGGNGGCGVWQAAHCMLHCIRGLVKSCKSAPDGMNSVGPRGLGNHLNLSGSDKEGTLLRNDCEYCEITLMPT